MWPGPAEYAMCAFGGLYATASMIAAFVLALHNRKG